MAVQIQIRRDLADNWTSANPVLAQGEMGYEIDTNMLKFGNGSDDWATLPYFSTGGGGVTDHGALTGLSDDDHPQYHTDARGDLRYYTQAQVDASQATQDGRLDALESAPVTDHGSLDGLTDDDHPQYLTEGRGDVRYPALQDFEDHRLDETIHFSDHDDLEGREALFQHPIESIVDLRAELNGRTTVHFQPEDSVPDAAQGDIWWVIDDEVGSLGGDW